MSIRKIEKNYNKNLKEVANNLLKGEKEEYVLRVDAWGLIEKIKREDLYSGD